MNIPANLANEIKLYLKNRAAQGELEAQTLLSQLEQIAISPEITMQQSMYEPPPDSLELGC
ncbi:MAG: hypothetical protein WA919_06930 [Coleofasciculaceae cyanobacterium]